MKLDDFEAVFRSSIKDQFSLVPPSLDAALLVTDLRRPEAEALLGHTVHLFASHEGDIAWSVLGQDDYTSVPELLGLIEAKGPDLIVCYRHLRLAAKGLAHSLGAYVDTLTQATAQPVLLLPPPDAPDLAARLAQPERVLVITDNLCGEDLLVNWGVLLCAQAGTLYLAHVEDSKTFERYSKLIAMIPDMDTDTTLARLKNKLLGRAGDYVETIAATLQEEGIQERVVPIVGMGHALTDYKKIVSDHDIQLLVMDTQDENQLAMHGMAYAISVEIQDRPLLLL